MKFRLWFVLAPASLLFSSHLAAQAGVAPPVADGGTETDATLSSQAAQAPTDDEQERMIAAAVAEAERTAPRIGASVGVEVGRAFRAPYARGLGASVAFTVKFEDPRGFAQLGLTGWPSAFYRGPEHAEERFEDWEVFLSAGVLPFTLGPVDFGFYLLLAASKPESSVANRAALGATVQWSFDRVWALRYQLGVTAGTNLAAAGLVSTLAIDMVFPYI
jgi:hypothetical protein